MGKSQNLSAFVCGGVSYSRLLPYRMVFCYERVSTVPMLIDQARLITFTGLCSAPALVHVALVLRGPQHDMRYSNIGQFKRPFTSKSFTARFETLNTYLGMYGTCSN